MFLKIKVSINFTLIPTAAFLLNPSALTASYKQLTKNYNVQSREIKVIAAMVSPKGLAKG